ncbi:MAG: DUF86 domain-containing protein [Bryobacteraceae bacterium]
MKDDRKYLAYILECIDRIEVDSSGGREDYDTSHMVQDAILRNLQTMAESTKRLSAEFKARYPEIDWRGIGGFRNFLVHDYLGVDPNAVWRVAREDLPKLKRVVLEAIAAG